MIRLLFFTLSAALALVWLCVVEPQAVPPVLGTVVLIISLAALYAALTEWN